MARRYVLVVANSEVVFYLQVMSKPCSCKFLYGEGTLDEDKEKVEGALGDHEEFKTELMLYRKNGENGKTVQTKLIQFRRSSRCTDGAHAVQTELILYRRSLCCTEKP